MPTQLVVSALLLTRSAVGASLRKEQRGKHRDRKESAILVASSTEMLLPNIFSKYLHQVYGLETQCQNTVSGLTLLLGKSIRAICTPWQGRL